MEVIVSVVASSSGVSTCGSNSVSNGVIHSINICGSNNVSSGDIQRWQYLW